jgi:hypothetical protein
MVKSAHTHYPPQSWLALPKRLAFLESSCGPAASSLNRDLGLSQKR